VSDPFSFFPLRTHFRRYRGRRVRFSCFALPDSFSGVQKASGPIIMLSFFALPNSFSMVRTASGPVIMSCAPGLIFCGTEGVRSRTRFQRYRVRLVPFSSFAHPSTFSALPRASGPVLLFCAVGPVFGGTNGVGSCIHVLRSRTHFRWYGRRRVPLSCFARPDSFSTVPRVSGP
jgi:hypothetical protein